MICTTSLLLHILNPDNEPIVSKHVPFVWKQSL